MGGLKQGNENFLRAIISALVVLFVSAQLSAFAHAPHDGDDAPDKHGVCAVCALAAIHNHGLEPASPALAPPAETFFAAMVTPSSDAPPVIAANPLSARGPPLR